MGTARKRQANIANHQKAIWGDTLVQRCGKMTTPSPVIFRSNTPRYNGHLPGLFVLFSGLDDGTPYLNVMSPDPHGDCYHIAGSELKRLGMEIVKATK